MGLVYITLYHYKAWWYTTNKPISPTKSIVALDRLQLFGCGETYHPRQKATKFCGVLLWHSVLPSHVRLQNRVIKKVSKSNMYIKCIYSYIYTCDIYIYMWYIYICDIYIYLRILFILSCTYISSRFLEIFHASESLHALALDRSFA